jgi:hypothetical protein
MHAVCALGWPSTMPEFEAAPPSRGISSLRSPALTGAHFGSLWRAGFAVDVLAEAWLH